MEPFEKLDEAIAIRGLRDDGISILITDHRERETLAITDRSYVVRAGKVLCHGTADEVLNNPDAKKYYFGESPGVTAA
jgi:lipopolysaccharide export system ATP-binding protein